jgi:3'-phosphoadenosine 5'-phosphosulfate sulfotransferase (PAPS reductase)/FAD synthetase
LTENEFILEDRKSKIKSVVEKYGEENFYISFSGGKDSTVLSSLVDMAVPGNKIPRVYCNTGIEYKMIFDFVFDKTLNDSRFIILKPSKNIKQVLENDGYPFKSKYHSHIVDIWQNRGIENSETVKNYLLLQTPKSGIIITGSHVCPKILKYQFYEGAPFKISPKCCNRLKKEPLHNFSIENNKPFNINGIMLDEGGVRETAKCLVFTGDKLKSFQPLAVVTKDWENWFIDKFNIDICNIYKPPYNLIRTGCKGCPFALELQEELDTLEKFFPQERKQCEYIWKPVYDEYRRLGYRLRKDDTIEGQMDISDFLGGKHE